jgi:hypothetical protein
MEALSPLFPQVKLHSHARPRQRAGNARARGGTVWDLFYIGLTIVVFGVLWLLVKGVERFER